MKFESSQEILFHSLISFFALIMAILSLNTDLNVQGKWKLLTSFIFWSAISFLSGFYASISAIKIINQEIFPIVNFLARIWKSYLLLFITCVNFISASMLFHRLANAIQTDTIEWFKRGFGADEDPPKISLAPVAKKILFGLISQLVLNMVIYAYGSPEIFFAEMSHYIQDFLGLIGII
ncbi:MAG: hypothetical protein ACTSVI_14645 [Promethearchaeota archaeon]